MSNSQNTRIEGTSLGYGSCSIAVNSQRVASSNFFSGVVSIVS